MLLFKGKAKGVLKIISNVLFFVFAAVVSYQGILLLQKINATHQVSPAVQIPMVVPYASYTVGFILVMIRLIQDTILLYIENFKSENS
jgi:TRAP-type C4-dicarboxylate transport system permease small subunit